MDGRIEREMRTKEQSRKDKKKWFCTGTKRRDVTFTEIKKNETRTRKQSLLGTLLEKIRGVERFGKKGLQREKEDIVCMC